MVICSRALSGCTIAAVVRELLIARLKREDQQACRLIRLRLFNEQRPCCSLRKHMLRAAKITVCALVDTFAYCWHARRLANLIGKGRTRGISPLTFGQHAPLFTK